MLDAVEQLSSQHGLFLCVECGKCVAVCPMGEIFDDFSYEVSPRGVIERALLGLEVLEHVGVWYCLTCELCAELCPAGVRFRDFVEATRRLATEAGDKGHGSFCRNCGVYLWPQHTGDYVREMLGEGGEDLLTLCPRCRRFALGERVKAQAPGSGRGRVREAAVGDEE